MPINWMHSLEVMFGTGAVSLATLVAVLVVFVMKALARVKDAEKEVKQLKEDLKEMTQLVTALDTRLDEDEKCYVLGSVCVKNHEDLNSRLDRERDDRKAQHREIIDILNMHTKKLMEIRGNGHG